ncbi:MAG: metal ABC transporter solute-binding protein, Zn/Mn family [Pseudonocardiaceae bacterium]
MIGAPLMTLRIPRLAGSRTGLTAALAVLLGVLGCGTSDQAATPDDRLTVVASTDVWASVVRAVTGDAVEVETIIDDPAGDPHSYESSPADVATVAGADLVVFNGGGYDEFVEQVLGQAGDKPTVEAYAHSRGGGANEHVWYDLPVVHEVAEQIAAELGKLAPQQAQQFSAGAETFGAGIDELRATVSTIAGAHPGAPVAMTEPVAYYLIEAAGLKDLTPPEFTEAVEEETDPPAAAVAATRDLFTQRQVRVLIYNPQTETPVTSQVRTDAEAAGIPVVTLTETLPEGTEYLGWMSGQIHALSVALG